MSVKVPYRQRRMRWRGLLEECSRSGLRTVEFCRQRGLALWQFYYWHGRLGGEREAAGCVAGVGGEEALFAPVVLPAVGAGLRLRLGGLEVEVAPDFDEATLKRLLRAMGAAC